MGCDCPLFVRHDAFTIGGHHHQTMNADNECGYWIAARTTITKGVENRIFPVHPTIPTTVRSRLQRTIDVRGRQGPPQNTRRCRRPYETVGRHVGRLRRRAGIVVDALMGRTCGRRALSRRVPAGHLHHQCRCSDRRSRRHTTFSSMQLDAVKLANKKQGGLAAWYLILSTVAGLFAAALGAVIARAQG